MADVLYRQAAQFYDALYRKNLSSPEGIRRETDNIERILKRHARVGRILDVGCGAGANAAELAGRGYDVLGIDLAREMLEIARARPVRGGARLEFKEADMRKFVSGRRFDAIICMTNAILCNYEDSHVRDALKCFAANLRPGGVALVEATSYGAMIAADAFLYTSVDSARVNGREVVEISINSPDEKNRVLKESNTYFIAKGDGTYVKHSSENKLRMISVPVFKRFLEEAGFGLAELIDADTLKPAGSKTAEYLFVAKRR